MSLDEKKVVKRRLEYFGKDCPVCEEDFKPYATDLASRSKDIPIEMLEITPESDAGKKIIETKGNNENIKMPIIKKCNIYESGEEDCKEIEGFAKEDYSDWEPKPQS